MVRQGFAHESGVKLCTGEHLGAKPVSKHTFISHLFSSLRIKALSYKIRRSRHTRLIRAYVLYVQSHMAGCYSIVSFRSEYVRGKSILVAFTLPQYLKTTLI